MKVLFTCHSMGGISDGIIFKKISILLLLTGLFFSFNVAVFAWVSDNGNGTYTNPILNADYPDCAVCRVGSDFYMVSSTFVSFPTVPILHSKDLVNWEIIGYAATDMNTGISYNLTNSYDQYGHGSWAPTICYRNGTFYVGIYESNGKFILCTATNPAGPYNSSNFSVGFHDPGLFIDDDGTGYVFYAANDVRVAKLGVDYKSVVSDTLVMTYNSITGTSGLVEGSHVIKKNGYYYIFKTSTPPEAYEYCFRSTSIYGPYSVRVILNGQTISGGKQIHQGGPVDTPTGEWWFVIFQDGDGLGRRDILIPMQWQNDWPVLGDPTTVKNVTIAGNSYPIGNVPVTYTKPNVGATYPIMTIPNADEFNSSTLGVQWQWNHLPDNTKWSLTERSGYLRLHAKNANNLWRANNTLTQRVEGPECQGNIELDTTNMMDGDTAGICLLNIPYGFIGVNRSGGVKKIIANIGGNKDSNGTVTNGPTLSGNIVYLRASANLNTNTGTFFYSTDNVNFTQLGGTLNMPFDLGFFQGDKLGIFNFTTASSGGYVDVGWFHSIGPRSAFSQIEAESYNTQSGIQTESCSEGGQNIGYIENGDYVVYNNIDFGNGSDSASFQARVASNTSGGNIEIRLDSITGTLVGTCSVTGTGGWQTWVTATCNVSGVSGTHNLYLKFTGASGYLFNMNWFQFTVGTSGNLITNPGMETGNTNGWTVNGAGSIAVSTTQKYSGTYSLLHTGRTATWNGPLQNMTSKVQSGKTYACSGWVKLDNAASDSIIMTIKKVDGSGTTYTNVATGTGSNSSWVQLSGNYTLSVSGTLTELSIYFEGPASGINYYVDDVSLQ
jgi:xylan 1,4-beta-xylosidase